MERVDVDLLFERSAAGNICGVAEPFGVDAQGILGEEAWPLLAADSAPEPIAERMKVVIRQHKIAAVIDKVAVEGMFVEREVGQALDRKKEGMVPLGIGGCVEGPFCPAAVGAAVEGQYPLIDIESCLKPLFAALLVVFLVQYQSRHTQIGRQA